MLKQSCHSSMDEHDASSDPGPFYHGTKANLEIGDILEPRHISNYGKQEAANYVYLTATLEAAIWGQN